MSDDQSTDDSQQQQHGLRCPRCGAGRAFLRVRDTDHVAGAIKRYRKCRGLFNGKKCGKAFTTIEKIGGVAKHEIKDAQNRPRPSVINIVIPKETVAVEKS